jgi:hypothetical protein
MTATKKSPSEAAPSAKHSDVRAVMEAATIRPPFDLERYAREQAGPEEREAPVTKPTQPPPASKQRAKLTGFDIQVSRASPPPTPDRAAKRAELCERFFVGDYAAALELAEALIAENALDEVVRDYADECIRALEKQYTDRVGSMRAVPVLLVPLEQIRSVVIDHQVGFFLAQVDGSTPLETLLDIIPMPRWEALRLVDRLVDEGVLMLGG